MTGQEAISNLLDTAKFQLTMVFKDLPEDIRDNTLHSDNMSFSTSVGHLCEVYTAVLKMSRGETHDWGTYTLPSSDWNELHDLMFTLRAECIEASLALPDEAGLKTLCDYAIAHDFYHVGQLVTLRIAAEPGWNSYGIYGH